MSSIKKNLYKIIFEHDTTSGKAFDLGLIIVVLISIIIVMLESVESINQKYSDLFFILEWTITILFSIELILRLYSINQKLKYIVSFYGIIDILAIAPAYLLVFIPGIQSFLILRALRLLRIFRILKLNQYTRAGQELKNALLKSFPKIIIFVTFILTLVTIVGAVMYFVEGKAGGFTSIPKSVYWAIVTMTTVGYGDITPQTILGQMLSSILMITGYGIIAVPTGIVSFEMGQNLLSKVCSGCLNRVESDANFCGQCGNKI